jgi:hypothetical protein
MTRIARAIGISVVAALFSLPALAGDLPIGTDSVTADSPLAQASSVLDAPSVETPLHRLYCVEYARLRSGLAIFGNASQWWSRARNLYTEVTQPVADAVMVFSRSRRIAKGHVAVVTKIVSAREIQVDQANWQNHGEIDHATPVLDVSRDNDWSKVRVWDMRSGQFGTHVYPVSGFIANNLTRQTANSAPAEKTSALQ